MMLPGWDKLQDLRGAKAPAPIPVATVPKPDLPIEAKLITDTQALNAGADTIVAARVLANISRNKGMSKLGAIADRIAAKKTAHDEKADEWATRLDALDRREPEAFAVGDAVIAEREHDVSDMEATMRQLSNLPLSSGK